MKELSLEEISLLEEMKSNCFNKGQYIDDKAKDKFNMLCHLEDFGIAYYDLLDAIKEVREYCINRSQYFNEARIEQYTFSREEEYSIENILEILDKEEQ